MAVLRESPWYQEILSEGVEQGETQMLLQVLRHRFGELDVDLVNAIRKLSTQQLEELVVVALNADSLQEVAESVAKLNADA